MSDLAGRRLIHVTTSDISLALLLGPQLEAFASQGMDVIGASAPGPFVDQLTRRGITHVPLRHATRSVSPGHDLLALFELEGLFRRLRPDIVHTHNPKPGLYGRRPPAPPACPESSTRCTACTQRRRIRGAARQWSTPWSGSPRRAPRWSWSRTPRTWPP